MEEKKIVVDAAVGNGDEIIKKDGKMTDKRTITGVAHIDRSKYIAAKQLRKDKEVDEKVEEREIENNVEPNVKEEDEPIV